MKLVRHGAAGKERPGLVDEAGRVRDLGGVVKDFDPSFFAGDGLRHLRGVRAADLPMVAEGARLGPCISRPGNFIAIGLNYVQHARETNAPIPTDPGSSAQRFRCWRCATSARPFRACARSTT